MRFPYRNKNIVTETSRPYLPAGASDDVLRTGSFGGVGTKSRKMFPKRNFFLALASVPDLESLRQPRSRTIGRGLAIRR
jgi:hypothetical protein